MKTCAPTLCFLPTTSSPATIGHCLRLTTERWKRVQGPFQTYSRQGGLRSHQRPPQTKQTYCYRLMRTDSAEEHVFATQQSKTDLARTINEQQRFEERMPSNPLVKRVLSSCQAGTKARYCLNLRCTCYIRFR